MFVQTVSGTILHMVVATAPASHSRCSFRASEFNTVVAGPLLDGGSLLCTAHVQYPGIANITSAAVESAAATVSPGYGRLRAACAALSVVADAGAPVAAAAEASSASGAAAAGVCATEAAAADSTAQLHVFSNPLYSVNTPKQVC